MMPEHEFASLLEDLDGERRELQRYLSALGPDEWDLETFIWNWSVRDVVSHLRVCDLMVELTCAADGSDHAAVIAQGEAETSIPLPETDALKETAIDVLIRELDDGGARATQALRDSGPGRRVGWGAGRLSAASLATARIMEYWAHGYDCRSVRQDPPSRSDRVWHICSLAQRTLSHAFARAGREDLDPRRVRIELSAPSGGTWTFGAADAPEAIRGDAVEWAMVGTRRWKRPMTGLVAEGETAQFALANARVFG